MHTYGIYLGIQIELRKVTMAYGHQIKENQMPGVLQLYRAKLKSGKGGVRDMGKIKIFFVSQN